MKKATANFLKCKKVSFNKQGQVLFVTSYLSNKTKKFYQFIAKKGS
jgi:hypothetical protein